MKTSTVVLWALALGVAAPSATAQVPTTRADARWARSVGAATLTLDGALTEPQWAVADSVVIRYGQSAGAPGSGWFNEEGTPPAAVDPIYTTVKFLSKGNDLWVAMYSRDASVGGSRNFNRKDGYLMDIRDKASANRPIPPVEFFYSWWHGNARPTDSLGLAPGFIGRYGNFDDPFGPRTAANVAAWDARTVVRGTSNDTGADNGYVTEMRFDLAVLGYTPNDGDGDIAEFNIQVYDVDYQNQPNFDSKRAWWQDAWGNTSVYNHARIHINPSVTTTSGATPALGPDVFIPNAPNARVTIDGRMNEGVWARADSFRVLFKTTANAAEADAIRNGYPGIGPWDSGQFQPELRPTPEAPPARASVDDPASATVKWFFKGDSLFVAAKMRDENVTNASTGIDTWDGFRLTFTDRDSVGSDNALFPYALTVRVGSNGMAVLEDNAVPLAPDTVRAALRLINATVNNVNDIDEGYGVEMALSLRGFGYPAGRGDGLAFVGATIFDYDSFPDPALTYGNRVWWFRERPGTASSATAYMDPARLVSAEAPDAPLTDGFGLLDAYPNPFRDVTTVRYALGAASDVTLRVYDALGREISERALGTRAAGEQRATVSAAGLASGLYYYVLEARTGGRTVTLPTGRLVVTR